MRGFFISLEGAEGVGKSTQVPLLAARLRAEGRQVCLVREPGGTLLGEQVREILLSSRPEPLRPLAELLLFSASRHQLVEQVIRPALEHGDVVLCDRFSDSTLAYQGFGRGIEVAVIRQMIAVSTGGLAPDLTLVLDLPELHGLLRARARTPEQTDRFEGEAMEFHRRVKQGFLSQALAEPERVKVIEATGTIDETAAAIWSLVDDGLRRHSRA